MYQLDIHDYTQPYLEQNLVTIVEFYPTLNDNSFTDSKYMRIYVPDVGISGIDRKDINYGKYAIMHVLAARFF